MRKDQAQFLPCLKAEVSLREMMNLATEIKTLLMKAKELDEYQNPHFLSAVLDAMVDSGGVAENELEDLYNWTQSMWSR